MSAETDTVPPVPEHTPPLQEDSGKNNPGKSFSHAWTRWFTSVRTKINVINESLVNLGDIDGGPGFLVKDGASWVIRHITGTSGRISVTNPTGASAEHPVIDLVDIGTPGTYGEDFLGLRITTDAAGRVVEAGVVDVPSNVSATGGTASPLPTQPVGYITVKVLISGAPTTIRIPYYT